MGQGAATTITPPRRKNTHRHTNLRPAPHYSTCHTEARSPVEIKCTNSRNKEKNPGKEGETLNQEEEGGREGNQEKPYATRTSRHAALTKLPVQRKQNVGTWHAHAPQQHTAGQKFAPMLTNNGKRYKRKQLRNSATNGQHALKERQKHSRP